MRRPEAAPAVALAVLAAGLAATARGFAAPDNLLAVLTQVCVVGVVALALNQVILAGEIDVSVGSLLAICAWVFGATAQEHGPALALAAALAVGAAAGAATGLVVTVARVPSIIATLGMLMVLRGIVLLLGADGVLLTPEAARGFGVGHLLGAPAPVVILALAFAAVTLLGRETAWGRDVLAVGSSHAAAAAVGLRPGRVVFWTFVATGLGCGLASAVFAGQTGEIQATAGTGFELQCIAAVVLGGTSITGGRGSTVAPLMGALLIGVILNGLTLVGAPAAFEQLALGLLILFAITVDALRARAATRGRAA